ncbi:hypothetical protein CF326_g1473 [Tilletia indica]|nr:hypothetical protein CF326_g1473 [Tilletia indica]
MIPSNSTVATSSIPSIRSPLSIVSIMPCLDVRVSVDSSADVVMDAAQHLLEERANWVLEQDLNKGDFEEPVLRTEMQVRARNDGTALRSMATLLQREVDALDLKMREEISMLKHDIQIEMNSRKAELKEQQNSFDPRSAQSLHDVAQRSRDGDRIEHQVGCYTSILSAGEEE